jgi:hypothetical protein
MSEVCSDLEVLHPKVLNCGMNTEVLSTYNTAILGSFTSHKWLLREPEGSIGMVFLILENDIGNVTIHANISNQEVAWCMATTLYALISERRCHTSFR